VQLKLKLKLSPFGCLWIKVAVVGLLNKSSFLAAALGVTKSKATIAMNWVTLCSAA
jgi:hypothetical protein